MTETTAEKVDQVAEAPDWVKTKFGAWVKNFGVMNLVAALKPRGHETTDSAIYYWLRGDAVPRPDKAQELIAISGGELTLEDIYGHQREIRAAKQL